MDDCPGFMWGEDSTACVIMYCNSGCEAPVMDACGGHNCHGKRIAGRPTCNGDRRAGLNTQCMSGMQELSAKQPPVLG